MNRLNFLISIMAIAILSACQPSQKKITIGYIQITQDPVLDAAKAGVFRALADSGFINGQNIKVLDNNAQGDLSMINTTLQAGQYLAGQKINALVASADNTVYLGLPVLAKLASGQKIPLFVTDPLQAEKGAAIGFGANYDQWGYQTGLKAVEILKGRASSGNPIEPILNYDLIINLKACADQGLLVPGKVTGRATRIIN